MYPWCCVTAVRCSIDRLILLSNNSGGILPPTTFEYALSSCFSSMAYLILIAIDVRIVPHIPMVDV